MIQDKIMLKTILQDFTDELFSRYYITNPPQITKSDNVDRGYGEKQTLTINPLSV